MTAASVARVDTNDVDPGDTIEYWEWWNRQSLVGLRASALTAKGFAARSVQSTVDATTITRIQGRPHLVERSPRTISDSPKHSVFLSVLLSGDGYLHRDGGTDAMRPGDALVYSTMQPYVQVFDHDMDLLIIDVEADFARARWGLGPDLAPVVVHRPFDIATFARRTEALLDGADGAAASPPVGEVAADAQSRSVAGADAMVAGVRPSADRGAADVLDLVESSLLAVIRPSPVSALRIAHRRALSLIEAHLGDAAFGVPELAAGLHVSERQLRRIFAEADDSPGSAILSARLSAAEGLLRACPRPTVTEVAHRCGFGSPSSFSRAFHRAHGFSPNDARGGALRGN